LNEEREIDEIRHIRVRYSTITGYLSIVYRTLTGLLFTIIVLRRLTIDEYGLFMLIMAYITLMRPVINIWFFWMYRFYARKRYDLYAAGGSLNVLYSLLSTAIMYSLTWYYTGDQILSLIVGFSMLLQLFIPYYNTIMYATRPYLVSYINVITDTLRVVIVYLLVGIWRIGLIGVIITFFMESLLKIVFGVVFTSMNKIYVPIPKSKTKDLIIYIKNSYISILNVVGTQLRNSGERVLTSIISGSYVFPAYLGVSYISRTLVLGGAQAFTRGIYTRLLRSPSKTDVEDVLRITFLTVVFVTGSMIIYAKPIISVVNTQYLNIIPIFIMYSFMFAILTINILMMNISNALEKEDLYKFGTELKHSILFKNYITQLLASVLHIIGGTVVFTILLNVGFKDPNILLMPYPIIGTLSYIYSTIIFHNRIKREIKYNIPFKELTASIIGSLIVYLVAHYLTWNELIIHSVYKEFIPIIVISFTSISIYTAVVYIISPWFRKMIRNSFSIIIRK